MKTKKTQQEIISQSHSIQDVGRGSVTWLLLASLKWKKKNSCDMTACAGAFADASEEISAYTMKRDTYLWAELYRSYLTRHVSVKSALEYVLIRSDISPEMEGRG